MLAENNLGRRALAELAEQTPPLTPAQLVRLCETLGIAAVCGEETRLRREDFMMVADAAEREAAFMGEG